MSLHDLSLYLATLMIKKKKKKKSLYTTENSSALTDALHLLSHCCTSKKCLALSSLYPLTRLLWNH